MALPATAVLQSNVLTASVMAVLSLYSNMYRYMATGAGSHVSEIGIVVNEVPAMVPAFSCFYCSCFFILVNLCPDRGCTSNVRRVLADQEAT